ncbi:MAG: DUF692 domain-containing protein [Deltaproteobacteria bacterium]|nr:DUF692 domain-containing protein [Deltaproteobacteria bacterium]
MMKSPAAETQSTELFGVGLRRPHFDEILDHHPGVDFLEVLSENFMTFGGRPREVLKRARERLPIVLHGVSLSLGSLGELNQRYLEKLAQLIDFVRPPWFSDHLSWAAHGGVEYHDLIPLPFTEEAVRHVVKKIKQVQDRVRLPFLLENPSYYLELPGKEMSEAEFVREVVTRADCGLLLDINNVYVNATNHGYDAHAFIESMPTGRVLQYHMAGHDASGEMIIDTHGSHIAPEVFALYQHAILQLGTAWTLVEWDNNIPSLEVLLEENDRVRHAAAQALGRARASAA